jgi:hypothetical protein
MLFQNSRNFYIIPEFPKEWMPRWRANNDRGDIGRKNKLLLVRPVENENKVVLGVFMC